MTAEREPFNEDPEPDPCSCCEALWLRRRLREARTLMAEVHDEAGVSPAVKRRINETLGVRAFYCCHPQCPGYAYQASEMPHPQETCGAKVVRGTAACTLDREGTDGDRPIAELVIQRVRRWLQDNAVPDRGTRQWDWAKLTLDLRYEGEDDDAGRSCYKCHLTEEIVQPEAEGHG